MAALGGTVAGRTTAAGIDSIVRRVGSPFIAGTTTHVVAQALQRSESSGPAATVDTATTSLLPQVGQGEKISVMEHLAVVPLAGSENF